MSGSGTFSGTMYQARVIAYVYVHILAQSRLGWMELFDDTPIGISGETEGPGDDAQVEFGKRHPPIEVQVKHGLKAGTKLYEAVDRIRTRSAAADATKVLLVVDPSSSRTVHETFAKDLERFRVDRTDGLRPEITRIMTELGVDAGVLRRLFVVGLDLDAVGAAHRKLAIQLLGSVLVETEQATAAWDVLVTDAGDLCVKKLRRTRTELIALLRAAKLEVRPPQKDERLLRQLDLAKRLLREEDPAAALAVLGILEADLAGKDIDPAVRYRAAQHRAAALVALDRAPEALAAARVALDLDPNGVQALMTAAFASVGMGDLPQAHRFIARALEVGPTNEDAWGAMVQISTMAGIDPPAAPAAVCESDTYQLALAQIAINAADHPQVEEITAKLLARGSRDARMLHFRALALAALSEGDDSSRGADRREEAERLANEAVTSLPVNAPLRVKLLVLRAELRRLRGDANALADLEAAIALDGHDPDAVANLALAQLHAGRADYALQTLRIRSVDEYPMLLVVRAQALAETGDRVGARRDVMAAISRVGEVPQPDSLRIFATEVALLLNDPDLAAQLLDAMESPLVAPEMQATLRGRIGFARGDVDAMQKQFRTAVEHAPALKSRLFSELAHRLLLLERARDAVAIFDEVGVDALPSALRREYAGALMQTDDLVRAADLVAGIGTAATAPEWALSIAAEIAYRRGDEAEAVSLLQRLAERRPDDFSVLFHLAQRLLAMDDRVAAGPYLDRLLVVVGTRAAADRMAVAHLLKEADRLADAAALGLVAFRMAPQDPAMHRAFGSLLLAVPPVSHSGTVTDETYVRLTSDSATRQYIIYKDPPIDPLRQELLFVDAEKLGLVGLRVGDTLVMHEGTWQEERWTVEEILPAIVHVFRDVITHFATRFPSEPFFVKMFNLPDETSVKFLAPIISTVQAKKERVEAIFRIYRENLPPLGFVASLLSSSISDVMAAVTAPDVPYGPFQAEWYDAEGQEEARSAAHASTVVVLTRSALETLEELSLLDVIASAYQWCAPQSLAEALRKELADAKRKVTEGQHSVMPSDSGIRLHETEPGDPALQARVDRVQRIAMWVTTHARLEFRPLTTLVSVSPENDAMTLLGHDSIDAVRLAEHFRCALLADDLGLRRLLPQGSPGRSFSTIALITVLAERGVISSEQSHRHLLRLVERNYILIVPTRALLVASILQAGGATAAVERVFALLGGPVLDLSSAARIGAETVRAVHLMPIQLVNVGRVTEMILAGLQSKWSLSLAGYALAKAAATELALLPQAWKIVRETAAEYVKQNS